jgi:hypothetical protein
MSSNVSVHPWPVEALHEALFGLVNAVVSGEQLTMNLSQCVRNKCDREKKYHSARFKLPFDSAPYQTIFDETIVGEKFN